MSISKILPVSLTGDRPTGQLHLGHYVGSLKTRLDLQTSHQQFILIADNQALTDNSKDPDKIKRNVIEVMADYLAVGLTPDLNNFCLQSALPALSDLTMFYLNFVTVSRLERNPTIRDEINSRGFERDIPAGFLCYPVSQAADITGFRANIVPVGEDQAPIIEQTNEIISKINRQIGTEFFTNIQSRIPQFGRLPGIDGKGKMSKSNGNSITLSATEKEISIAVAQMYTDPNHLKISDPGKTEGNIVFSYLDAFDDDKEEVEALKVHYRKGGLGDSTVKRRLIDVLNNVIGPIRERRLEVMKDKGMMLDILKDGTQKSQIVTTETYNLVRYGVVCLILRILRHPRTIAKINTYGVFRLEFRSPHVHDRIVPADF
jgi:tryptophanyl-tRNA synthetase